MANPEKALLGKLKTLMAAQREVLDKFNLLAAEIDEVLNGGASIGQRITAVKHAFSDAWNTRYPGAPYAWTNYAKDAQNIKRLLKTLPVAEIAKRAAVYLKNDDLFYVSKRHPFDIFVVSINSHAEASGEAGDLELQDDVQATRDKMRALRNTSAF